MRRVPAQAQKRTEPYRTFEPAAPTSIDLSICFRFIFWILEGAQGFLILFCSVVSWTPTFQFGQDNRVSPSSKLESLNYRVGPVGCFQFLQ